MSKAKRKPSTLEDLELLMDTLIFARKCLVALGKLPADERARRLRRLKMERRKANGLRGHLLKTREPRRRKW